MIVQEFPKFKKGTEAYHETTDWKGWKDGFHGHCFTGFGQDFIWEGWGG